MNLADTLTNIALGFKMLFAFEVWIAVLLGLLIGLVIGAIPGLTATIGLALFVPFTFFLPPLVGLPFLVGIYKGADVGSFVPAVLFRVPGTPASAATLLDGYPMAQKGYPNKALQISLASSVTGDLSSDILLLFTAPFLAVIALALGVPERFAIVFLTLVVIGVFVGASPVKGLAAGALGLLFSTVGIDGLLGSQRFTFGYPELADGIALVPALLGVFALPEVMHVIGVKGPGMEQQGNGSLLRGRKDDRLTWREYKELFPTIMRGTVIGSILGAAPGIGPNTAGFMSWSVARKLSRNPEEFGNGSPHGIAASESANSAVNGPNLIPLFALGIPGSMSAAVLMSAFLAQGITPGAPMFRDNAATVYAFLLAMIGANVFMYTVGRLALLPLAQLVKLPNSVMVPAIVILSVAGCYSVKNSWLDVWMMVGFGLLGYLMRRYEFPAVPFIIALILGRPLEDSLMQSLMIFDGNLLQFFTRPVSGITLGLAIVTVLWSIVAPLMRRRAPQPAAMSG